MGRVARTAIVSGCFVAVVTANACGSSYDVEPLRDLLVDDAGALDAEPAPDDASDVDASTDGEPSDGSTATDATDGAPADPLPFLGTGADGVLTRGAATGATDYFVPNKYAKLATDVAANAPSVTLESAADFSTGDLVMLWRTAGLVESGDMSALVDLAGSPVGQYQLHRVTAKSGAILTLTPPAAMAFPAASAQVVRVPEYESATLLATSVVTATPWDGRVGGIVAFLVKNDLTMSSGAAVSVYAAGFRGGLDDNLSAVYTCPATDGIPANGYAPKGEGLISSWYGAAVGGSPAHGNGGGGGACHNAGGGGGGNGTVGGRAGLSYDGDGARDVGGRGGARVAFAAQTHLVMGGGGGAGEANTVPTARGVAGGGAMFIRARSVLGQGLFHAGGNNGLSAVNGGIGNGGSGGGAGGTISIEATVRIDCSSVNATGGNGGSALTTDSPGGGGGGGHVRLVAPQRVCVPVVVSGRGGALYGTSNFAHHGALPASQLPGVVE